MMLGPATIEDIPCLYRLRLATKQNARAAAASRISTTLPSYHKTLIGPLRILQRFVLTPCLGLERY
jgi:hypothetical protein